MMAQNQIGRGEREALVACTDRNLGTGIDIWDLQTGHQLTHISTCASPSHGLLCLKHHFLVASQHNKHGSVAGGAIFAWPLNKPQSPIRSYPIEAIGPICCSMGGMYLAGGATSGNAYIWEVASGRLLKTWHAHQTSLKCMVFSIDDSFLISGSGDGMICVWSLISLLDVENFEVSSSLLHYSVEHKSSISGLLTVSGSSNSTFLSSSLDATCKAWDLASGRLVQTQEYQQPITAVTLHPAEQFLFAGSKDGRIFISEVNIGMMDEPFGVLEDQLVILEGHKGSITALTFSTLGLISASEDCTVCLWDASSWTTMLRFNYHKGPVTNVLVIPCSSLLTSLNHQRTQYQFRVSELEKCPQPAKFKGTVTFLRNNETSVDFSNSSLDRQIFEMEEGSTPAALQMKLETSINHRMWATRMTKHIMQMNKHLQTRLVDLMQTRLLRNTENDSATTSKNKKHKIATPSFLEEKLL